MWTNHINWQNIQPMTKLQKYKNQFVTYTFFYHYFYFYNSNFDLNNNISYVKIKQVNYQYNNQFESYLTKLNIAYSSQDYNIQYAWFVNTIGHKYICLHKS